MSKPRELHYYGYVERPYEAVRALLRGDPLAVFRRATTSASARAEALRTELHLAEDGVRLSVDLDVRIERVRDEAPVAGLPPVTTVALVWKGAKTPSLFPILRGGLSAWPVTSAETQLVLEGAYEPPLGLVGDAFDVAIGHRIAEATVHRFLEEVLSEIRREIPASGASRP